MRILKQFLFLGVSIERIILSPLTEFDEDSKTPDQFYQKYAVNTESELASNIGKKILEMGGNALDAAIASSLTIGIVNSFSSGIGGGGFLLIRRKINKKNDFHFFDFRETAPEKINPELFKANPGFSKTTGLSVAVPGEIYGLYEAHKRFGKLPWKSLFKYPIKIANEFKASKKLVEKLEKNEIFILKDPGLRQTFTKNNRLIKVGEKVRRKNLAKTLETLSKDPISFYEGELSDKIVEFLKSQGGILSKEDLANYKVKERPVLRGKFYDYDVITTNIPTSGLFIIEALNILERINIRDIKYFINNENSFLMYHILIEIFKFISSDRGKLGDPDYIQNWRNIVNEITSDDYARKIFLKIDLNKVLDTEKYGQKIGFKEDHGTTHLNVVDEDEMIVSMTSTINLEFGSKLLDPETGIIFNNHIDDFYIPGVDNYYNLAPMANNTISGGKRAFSSASPTILIKSDEILAIGAAGGTRIPTAMISSMAYLFAGNTLKTAISLCRMHNQLNPLVTYIEPTLPDFVIKKLSEMGHDVKISDINTAFTSVQAIQIKKIQNNEKRIFAVSDDRKDGGSDGE